MSGLSRFWSVTLWHVRVRKFVSSFCRLAVVFCSVICLVVYETQWGVWIYSPLLITSIPLRFKGIIIELDIKPQSKPNMHIPPLQLDRPMLPSTPCFWGKETCVVWLTTFHNLFKMWLFTPFLLTSLVTCFWKAVVLHTSRFSQTMKSFVQQ